MKQRDSKEANVNSLGEQYLSTLRELSLDFEAAIGVLVINSLPELQEHVARQEVLASKLQSLTKELGAGSTTSSTATAADSNLWNEIRLARTKLAELNRRYGTFLQYSRQNIGLLVELCRTYEEDSSISMLANHRQQTLSCEV